jgi:hypothetical protein
MKVALTCLIALAHIGFAQDYQLELIEQFQLPSTSAEIDVQFWTDSDSIGWAWGYQQTVVYSLAPSATPVTFQLADSLRVRDHINCCVLDGEPCLLIYTEGQIHEIDMQIGQSYYILLVRLNPLTVLEIVPEGNYQYWHDDPPYFTDNYSRWREVGKMSIWPPPPAESQHAVYSYTYNISGQCGNGCSYSDGNGTIRAMQLPDTTTFTVGGGRSFDLFRDTDTAHVAVYDYTWEIDDYQGHGEYTTTARFYTHIVGDTTEPQGPETTYPGQNGYLLAQQDLFGTKRVIRAYSNAYNAYDAWTYDSLWSGPGADALISVVMDESLNGRLWKEYSSEDGYRSFEVFDAADGQSLGLTSNLYGSVVLVARREGAYDAVVTRINSTASIYVSNLEYPEFNIDLTLTSEYDLFRLRWNAIPDARSYSIYVAYPDYFTEPAYLTTILGTTYSFPISGLARGEFTVHANF